MNNAVQSILGLAAVWIVGLYVFATISGWRTVSGLYSSAPDAAADGEAVNFVTARFGRFVIYRSCLKAIVSSKGLLLSPMLLLRLWHGQIYLPWSDVTVERRAGNSLAIIPLQTPNTRIVLSDTRVVKALHRYGVIHGGEQTTEQTKTDLRLGRVLLVWLITGVLGGSMLGFQTLTNLTTLTRNGLTVTGKVESMTPSDHHSLRYSFSVGGTAYSATATDSGFGNPRYEQLRSGSPITVTYNKVNPANSIPGLALPAFYSQLRVVLLFAAVFGALVAYYCQKKGWFGTRK